MQHRMVRDRVVQWHGGGYSGCIWEPNTGFFDAAGEWHPVISTGGGKRDTPEEFWRQRVDRYFGKDDDLVFPITKEGLLEFQENIRDDFFMHTLKALEDAGYEVWWKCSDCGEAIEGLDEFVQYEGYRGDGGIGVMHEGPVCEDCYSMGQCFGCNDYAGQSDLDEYGLCWSCKQDAGDDEVVGPLFEDIERVKEQCDRMKEVKPEKAGNYDRQAEAEIDRIKDILRDALEEWSDRRR